VAESESLGPPDEALRDFVRWLDASGNPWMIIGGMAVSLLGVPRTTEDFDAMVIPGERSEEEFIESAAMFGIVPRVSDAAAFARRRNVLLLTHAATGTGLDVSLGFLPFEVEAVDRAQEVAFHGIRVRIPTPEDAIVTKAVASRDLDWADISNIVKMQRNLDHRRILSKCNEFAQILERPEMVDRISELLKRKGRKRQ
jgi:hypothetical protein